MQLDREHALDKARREARLIGRGQVENERGETGRDAERRAVRQCRRWAKLEEKAQ